MTTDQELTPRQAAFVAEYMVDLNGAAAAVRAGYSANSAKEQAARLLTNANVQAAIAAAQAERSEQTRLKAIDVVEQLRRIAFANIDDIVAWNHEKVIFRHSQKMTPETLSAVAEVSYDKNGGVRVRLYDKIAALDKCNCSPPPWRWFRSDSVKWLFPWQILVDVVVAA
jgi:phage terminase small subunit